MTLEENILAYLDGSLGTDQSAELLHTLSASPDKRELLEQHLRLKDITTLGKRPYAVPEHAERALAQRLPAIHELSNAERIPLPWFSTARVMSIAAGVGAIAIVGALIWNPAQPGAILHSVDARQSEQPFAHNSISTYSTDIGRSAANSALQTDQSLRSNAQQSSGSSGTARPASQRNKTLNGAPGSEQELFAVNDGRMHVQPTVLSVAPTDASSDASEISSVALRETERAIPGTHMAHTLAEIPYREPSSMSAFSFGVNYSGFQYSLPRLGASAAGTSVMAGDVSAALKYNLSSKLALGLEDGLSRYAILSSAPLVRQGLPGATQNYTRVDYSTTVGTASTMWLRLGLDYSPNPESEYPLTIGAAGGVAFENSLEPIGAVSAGFSRFLGGGTWIDLDLVATGTWGAPGSVTGSSSGPDVTGIVHMDVTPQQTFTPAIGLRLGLRYR